MPGKSENPTPADNNQTATSAQIPSIFIPCRLLKAELDLQTATPVSSFLAATIRGGFGYTLKRIVCIQPGVECCKCMMKTNCIYPFLFETPPPPDATRLSKYRNIPRPFAIRPMQTGSNVTIDLLLIGKAVAMLPVFVYTLNELGKQGLGRDRIPFTVNNAVAGTDGTVYSADKPDACTPIAPHFLEIAPGEPRTGSVTLTFETPLVIRKDEKILATFEPYPFFTTLLRRITNLNAFYGDAPDTAIDPAPWLDAAKSITCETDTKPVQQHRYSTRQKKEIDYSGITGNTILTGDIGTLLPLLRAGEVLGVGKNTVFGYGRYRWLREPQPPGGTGEGDMNEE